MRALTFLLIIFLHTLGSSAFCGEENTKGVTLIHEGEQALFLSIDSIKKVRDRVTSRDPNFESKKLSSFSGIPLKRFLEKGGLFDCKGGVTVIGHDQYAVYLPQKMVEDPRVILAVTQNGEPLPMFKGGPVKLILPPEYGLHLSAYCWYVETIVAGEPEAPKLTIDQGETRKIWTPKTLESLSSVDLSLFLSIPRGYRVGGETLSQPARIRAVSLTSLFGKELGGLTVTFVPFSGRSLSMPGDILSGCHVLLVYAVEDERLHTSLGGPFSVYFPVMRCKSLDGVAPDSGALFFIKEIRLE